MKWRGLSLGSGVKGISPDNVKWPNYVLEAHEMKLPKRHLFLFSAIFVMDRSLGQQQKRESYSESKRSNCLVCGENNSLMQMSFIFSVF